MARSCPPVVGMLPAGSGVYRFRDASDRVLYIGRASVLRSRVGSYWSDLGDRRHLAPMVARIARIEAVSCDSVHEAAWLERNLLENSLPLWNRTPGGQESAAYIRLDAGPVNPGLAVAYQAEAGGQGRYFGPYLGGLRVRQAIAALHRILPLPYAGALLGGTERELARVRGAGAADRAALAASITAILERQPAAVAWAHGQLEQLRDGAARTLAYELAARIRDEIAALTWVTSPQRAATMDAADLAIAGWSRGILVEFQIRGGRLDGWSQRPCGLPAAAAALTVTPAAWRGFTQRNAELAASMAEHS